MRVGFSEVHIESLAALWNSCLPPKFQVSPELLAANTVECPVFDWGASCVEVDDDNHPKAFVAVKKSAAMLYKGPDPDTANISAIVCPNPRQGVELMSYVKRVLRFRGTYKISFGQDCRHFFPGCPMEWTTLRDFLMVEGFHEGTEVVDLERDVATYTPPPKALDPLDVAHVVRPVEPHEVNLLDEFLEREFPGRWRYDVMSKVQIEGRSDFVYGLFMDSRIEGFAFTQDWTHKLPISGAVFNKHLGANWGGLGPIGVSKKVRGRGLGDAVLASGLLGLKARGARQTVIDWTVLADWYGKHGFRPSRTYKSFTLKLDESSF